ncbi:MAG: GtrA family protein [Candidatus Dadabacteria bacterium]
MFTFFKAQVASLTASIVDYSLTIVGVELFGLWYVLSSIIGTVIGAITNFSIGRSWVFQSKQQGVPVQAVRYIVVWLGYLVLTTSSLYAITHFLKINYIISKLMVTLVLAVIYNYPLQKKFVFKKH